MTEGVIFAALLTALVLVLGVTLLVDDGVPGDVISTIRCGDGEITTNDGTVHPMPEHLQDDFESMSYVEFTTTLRRCGVVTYSDLYGFDFREEDVNHE